MHEFQRNLRLPFSFGVVALIVLMTLLAPRASARKFPPVGVKCSKDYSYHRIDGAGLRDTCVQQRTPKCPADTTLTVDMDDVTDACIPVEGAVDQPETQPTCDSNHKLHVAAGDDTCERSQATKCRRGYDLKVSKGDDLCIRR